MSALITDAHNPETGDTSLIWPMYQFGEVVFIQNQLLLPGDAPRPFTLEKVIENLLPRETSDEEGERISEWQIGLLDIAEFRAGAERPR